MSLGSSEVLDMVEEPLDRVSLSEPWDDTFSGNIASFLPLFLRGDRIEREGWTSGSSLRGSVDSSWERRDDLDAAEESLDRVSLSETCVDAILHDALPFPPFVFGGGCMDSVTR